MEEANFSWNLEDIMERYPPQDDPFIQARMSGLYEFIEKASVPNEPKPTREDGDLYYNHQEALMRYLRVYSGVLVIDEAGTGKTCSVAAVTEYIDDQCSLYYDGKPADANALKYRGKALVLVPGKNQREEIKKQLVCVCSDKAKYQRPGTAEDIALISMEGISKSVTSRLDKRYEIHHFEEFYNNMQRRLITETEKMGGNRERGEESLRREFSNRVIWIDEGHRLITTEEPGLREAKQEGDQKIKEQATTKSEVNSWVRNFIHSLDDVLLVITTATPLAGHAENVKPMMNLLLPNDQQLTDQDIDNDERLLEAFRGRISYVKADEGVVTPVYENNYAKFTPAERDAIEEFAKRELRAEESSIVDTLYYTLMSAAQIKQFHRGMSDVENRGRSIKAMEELRPNTLEGFARISPGVVKMCDIAVNKYDIGTVLIFSPYIQYSLGGVEFIGEVLKVLGYTQYIPPQKSTVKGQTTQAIVSYCTGGTSGRPSIAKKNRYAVIIGTTTANAIRDILGVINSVANVAGEYIRILIISPTASEGISVSHVSQIHLSGPTWTWTEMYQAERRGLRVTSQLELIRFISRSTQVRKLLATRGIQDPALRKAVVTVKASAGEGRFPVKIYRHCRYYFENGRFHSPECRIYLGAYKKNEKPEYITNLMKESAYNCLFNPTRSYPTCVDEDVEDIPISTTNWTLLYSKKFMQKVWDKVMVLAQSLPMSVDEAVSSLLLEFQDMPYPQALERTILTAINEMINTDVAVTDIYGYTSYLRQTGNYLYLSRGYRGSYDEWIYGTQVHGYTVRPLSTILQDIYRGPTTELYQKILVEGRDKAKLTQEDQDSIDQRIRRSGREGMICLVESAVAGYEEVFYSAMEQATQDYERVKETLIGPQRQAFVDNKEDYILSKFAEIENDNQNTSNVYLLCFFALIVFKVPRLTVTEIESYGGEPAKKTKKKTKKKKEVENVETVVPHEELYVDPTSLDYVIVHSLDSVASDLVSGYNIISRYNNAQGDLRLYDPKTKTWTTLKSEGYNPMEYRAYNAVIRGEVYKIYYRTFIEKIKGKGIFALMFPNDSMIRLVDKSFEPITKKDKRKRMRGQLCKGYSKIYLVYQFRMLNYGKASKLAQDAKSRTKKKLDFNVIKAFLVDTISGSKDKFTEETTASILSNNQQVEEMYYLYKDNRRVTSENICAWLAITLAEKQLFMNGINVAHSKYPLIDISSILE